MGFVRGAQVTPHLSTGRATQTTSGSGAERHVGIRDSPHPTGQTSSRERHRHPSHGSNRAVWGRARACSIATLRTSASSLPSDPQAHITDQHSESRSDHGHSQRLRPVGGATSTTDPGAVTTHTVGPAGRSCWSLTLECGRPARTVIDDTPHAGRPRWHHPTDTATQALTGQARPP